VAKYLAFAPSNIAFVKYWGKKAKQSPANASLSMTLAKLGTQTKVEVSPSGVQHRFFFEGREYFPSESFAQKSYRHLKFLSEHTGFKSKLRIESANLMPHSAGLASSASSMAALTLAALAAWTESKSLEELSAKGFDLLSMAQLSRMASGSSSRSFFGGYVKWNEDNTIEQTYTASAWRLHDVVVLVKKDAKKLSSSEGHERAPSSPFFRIRKSAVPEWLSRCNAAIATRNISRLGETLEEDALMMHSVMATSSPSHTYLEAATVAIIEWLRGLRIREQAPVYFTLDAGPNVHLIVEPAYLSTLLQHLSHDFSQYEVIVDEVGNGVRLSYVD
jgi:diphosphomevalonate decarboxylase